MCDMASSNNTKFIIALTSLWLSSASVSNFDRSSQPATARYFGSPIPPAKCEYISGLTFRASSSKS